MSSRPRANSTSSALRQRPGAGDLVEPQPHVVRLDLVDAELVERLAHVEIALADRDDADLRAAPAGEDDVVEVVGAHEGQHGVALEVLQPRLLLEEAVRRADVEAARRHAEVVAGMTILTRSRRPSTEAVELDVVLDAFERRPGAAEAAQGDSRRGRSRSAPGRRPGSGSAIITSTKANSDWCATVEDSAVWSSPISASTPPCFEEPAMLAWRNTSPERSTPGPLPYQTPKTPSYLPSPRSSACCEPQSAVAASSSLRPGWKTMSFASKPLLGAPEVLVEAADRRAAIAGDEAGGVQPGAPVALALHQQHADDRLRAGDEDAVLRQVVFVVEGDVSQRSRGSLLSIGHRPFPPRGSTPIRRVQVRSVQLCQ